MNPLRTFIVGIAPDHIPGLVAAILLPFVILVARRLRPSHERRRRGPGERRRAEQPAQQRTAIQVWVAWLLGITAVVHLALPLGHSDNWLLTVGFLGSGAAFAWLAVRAWEGRTYRLLGPGCCSGATMLAYLLVAGTGKEEPDQVGIVTAMVELLALGLCLVPGRDAGETASGSSGSSARPPPSSSCSSPAPGSGSGRSLPTRPPTRRRRARRARPAASAGSGHDHGHDHAARAQAGVIMRPRQPGTADPGPGQGGRRAGPRDPDGDGEVRQPRRDAHRRRVRPPGGRARTRRTPGQQGQRERRPGPRPGSVRRSSSTPSTVARRPCSAWSS